MQKFQLLKAPHVRSVDIKKTSTNRMMIDVLIALTPIIIFAIIYNGVLPFISEISKFNFSNFSNILFLELLNIILILIKPIANVFIGAFSSFLFEALYFVIFKKIRGFKNVIKEVHFSFAILPGIFLSLVLPVTAPLWMIVLGCFVANIIFKMLFGGFGHNIFNPALIGYAFLSLCFAGTLSKGYSDFLDLTNTVGSTPLSNLSNLLTDPNTTVTYENVVGSYGGLWNLFLGFVPGALGETCALLCIVGFIYLVVRKVINWYVPTIYVSTVFVITSIMSLVNGYGIWFPVFNIISGGLLFGAVFMATEPVTTPRNPLAKCVYALFLGVLTCLFRFVGSMPESVATSILLMCLFTPLLDRFFSKVRANKHSFKNAFITTLVLLIAGFIGTFVVVKTQKVVSNYEIVEYSQDFNSENTVFNVSLKTKDDTLHVKFKLVDNELVYLSDLMIPQDKLDGLKHKLNELIYSNGFVLSRKNNKIYVVIKGHNGLINAELSIDNDQITGFNVLEHSESVNYSEPVKNAFEVLPGRLVEAGTTEGIENISGATVSCNALKGIYQVGLNYLEFACKQGYVYSDQNNNLIIYIKGHNGMIKASLSYEGDKITSFEILKHSESVNYSEPVKNAFEVLPGAMVEAGTTEGIENISGATVSCNALKNIFNLAKDYLTTKYKTGFISLDDGEKLIIDIRGHNGMIKASLSYEGDKITSFEILKHNESVNYSEPVKNAFEVLPGAMVEAGTTEGIENISGATVSCNALKNIFNLAKDYLTTKYKTGFISLDDGEKLIIDIRGHNGMIKASLSYEGDKITSFEILKHSESVNYSEPVKNAFEVLPGAMVEAGTTEGIENISGATVSCNALKNIFNLAKDYLTTKYSSLTNNYEGRGE